MTPLIDQKNLDFLLYDWLQAEQLTSFTRYQEHDRESFAAILDTARQMAEQHFAPHAAKADACEPSFDGKQVHTLPELKQAWQHYAEAGFIAATQDYQLGGLQLPILMHTAASCYFQSANPASTAYPFLTAAAANLIQVFGNDLQKRYFLDAMLTGRFAGTMAMTEPNVGSSLGDLTTKARLDEQGHYWIKGQKMFISGGDQDITENIVHLVLARIEGAPDGVKGISLFIVPKFLVHPEGGLGRHNDVHLAGLLHKMGYRGTTSTVLNFGENDQCLGYLIGEAGHGLKYMFQMMNEARIGVGLGATMIGYRGYLASLAYAKARPQGHHSANKTGKMVNIIEHTDVKRMLLAQKAYVEGALSLCLYAAKLCDEQHANAQQDSGKLLDLLIPVVKSFPATYCTKANDLAIQVLGGAGYTRDYPVEQCYRDNRLNPIHEGTSGIQALDLLGRKLWQDQGAGLALLLQRIQHTLTDLNTAELITLGEVFQTHLNTFQHTTQHLGKCLQNSNSALALGNATLYLDIFSKIVVAWLWLSQTQTAQRRFAQSSDATDRQFYAGKLQAARYFMLWELPKIQHQAALLNALDSTCHDMQSDWF